MNYHNKLDDSIKQMLKKYDTWLSLGIEVEQTMCFQQDIIIIV
jgi:hypothetical protein